MTEASMHTLVCMPCVPTCGQEHPAPACAQRLHGPVCLQGSRPVSWVASSHPGWRLSRSLETELSRLQRAALSHSGPPDQGEVPGFAARPAANGFSSVKKSQGRAAEMQASGDPGASRAWEGHLSKVGCLTSVADSQVLVVPSFLNTCQCYFDCISY